jgi:hypothetical protein
MENGLALPETDMNVLKEGYTATMQSFKNTYALDSNALNFSFED